MTESLALSMVRSWAAVSGTYESTEKLLSWIEEKNETIKVNIKKIALHDCVPWFYDEERGVIRNQIGSFFEISGINCEKNGKTLVEQPIILQPEIGYLGIICKKINGILHFLMQAKIEPGNVNKVQISPTIQATKSNFTQKHGGRKPAYLDYFLNSSKYRIIVDQIQSEQSSRFYKKRNRNIIIEVDEQVNVLSTHKWMTLGQLKQLMKYDNLVNMDTRTVLSCIPFCSEGLPEDELKKIKDCFNDKELFESIFGHEKENLIPEIYQYINNYKMFDESSTALVPLSTLSNWKITETDVHCSNGYSFKVIFCDIEIDGREVVKWTQPLFEANGCATYCLICTTINGKKMYLVRAKPEIGCFDKIELGPSVQLEPDFKPEDGDVVTSLFMQYHKDKQAIVTDVLLSEEGGRFYCEQNHNVILNLDAELLENLPSGYFLVDYKTLNTLVQVNNCLNIQLRNLLSLLEV